VPVLEVAEIDSHCAWTCINLSANSNKKNHTNQKKTKATKQKKPQANQATEWMHFNTVTFNKSMSQGSRGEARKQIYIKPKGCHQH